jgi:hypothetical protein
MCIAVWMYIVGKCWTIKWQKGEIGNIMMLRYDFDDYLWAFKYVLWNWDWDMFCDFWEDLRISLYVLKIMKVKFCWTMHEHENKSIIIL